MAAGDPMIFKTLYNGDAATASNYDSLLINGNLERWANTAAAADSWTWVENQVVTFSREAGFRSSGAGSYYQRIAIAAPGQDEIGSFEQTITLNRHELFSGGGHLGAQIYINLWAKNAGAGTSMIEVWIQELSSADASLYSAQLGIDFDLTVNWQIIQRTHTVQNAATAKIKLRIRIYSTVAGSATIDLDDVELYFIYTTACNPSYPDHQLIDVPMRTFRRVLSGRLLRSRPAGPVAKIQKSLRFAMIGQTQYDRFLSLWLLDSPMMWTPNHPHLPATVQVRWIEDFDFHSIGPFSSGPLFAGTMVLSEI